MIEQKKYDLVVWGATGFTGQLVCEYLASNYNVNYDSDLRWAIAGRNQAKLENIRTDLIKKNNGKGNLPVLIGDSHKVESLVGITAQTKVVLTTVGPYLHYGETLVSACITTGTHYCDITGEIPFIWNTIHKLHDSALKAKVKIVHSCGFDSIPSDLGCLFLQNHAIQSNGKPCTQVKLFVEKIKGGVSGGTVASMIAIIKRVKDKKIKKLLFNPFALYPEGTSPGPKQPWQKKTQWDKDMNCWTSPFIMAQFNSCIVRRSNALLNFKYNPDFLYEEIITLPNNKLAYFKGELKRISFKLLAGLLYFPFTRSMLQITLLPKPGQGPSKNTRDKGFFRLKLVGKLNGEKFGAQVSCEKDPGYSGTAQMISEAALCLAIDALKLPKIYGILTPASSMGTTLIDRLQNSGMNFSIISDF